MRARGILGAALLVALAVAAQAQERTTSVQRGQTRYQRYCSACHGAQGGGDGPMASSLRDAPPDLRRIVERSGSFDRRALAAAIDGRTKAHAHGSLDSPVWGWKGLRARPGSGFQPSPALRDLLDYLESIQIRPEPKKETK